MRRTASRRAFLGTSAAAGTVAAIGDLGFLSRLRPVSAEEAQPDVRTVRLSDDIEPLVRLLEDTPREKLLEEVGTRVRAGLSYRELVAALLLAGVRNIQPRPQVGFKFHAVLVVNSAHLASLSSPPEHRWLPIFWALDEFKKSQEADRREGDWRMAPVDESAVPPAHRAKHAFVEAMDNWDEAAADAAIAGLARTSSVNEIYELMFRYGARDFRSIGHKAIYVANSLRTLNCVGWQHSEPVLRSLAYALLMHEGENPAKRDGDPDRSWRQNVERAAKVRPEWRDGKADSTATSQLLSTLREGTVENACNQVVEMLGKGVSPQSIWDALFVSAGELNVRQSGILALHAVTSTNALHYAWQTSGDDETRRMLLLQNAAFLPLFRQSMSGRGSLASFKLDELAPQPVAGDSNAAIGEICADISGDRLLAAGKLLSYLKTNPDPHAFIDAARVLVFLKGNNSHDYKFSSAALEDYFHISPEWRDQFLASSVYNLRGSQGADNQLVSRIRGALA